MIKLCNILDCTGCGSCYNACPKKSIKMMPSAEGFLYPEIDVETCIECGLCQKKCPILNPVEFNIDPKVYASWSLDNNIHTTSSSGGMFSELSKWIFERGGVVFGVILNDNLDAVHVSANSMEEIEPMKGSKYFQSVIGNTYQEVKELLVADEWVLYSGTPCQIAGLLKYLSPKKYVKLITVDMVCHGVPSSLFFKEYLNKLDKIYPQIEKKSYRFRVLDKWTYVPSVKNNGKRINISYKNNVYLKLFLANYISRESCYNCQYTKINRVSDLTIADFWGIGKSTPFNHDTKRGVSLTLVNSDKGVSFFDDIKDRIFFEERKIEEALVENHQLYCQSVRPKWGREIVYKYFENHTILQTNLRFFWKSIIKGKIVKVLKVFGLK